ncbi:type II toxin-antitoxin system death-on-curing family toxin [Stutzerimonas kirkiae]|uniref:Type II toxin-antitoxin system death-on-curing family toxin n=1 Tax=Stutzerimonas kirkiae TaxID=2211392 RepID=A0A4Q9R9G8_9GAMM|nr:type II toxin-antitoxin system death-on-curing family toxin [Stutzerimonas kirkiae]TBU96581.1 type II toxin-antitoxin system death-on-curing family toxin [Stutzerimonas kirkiae]TBV02136.1 type II toxin-antitoxin system death-on-curing family toxin [Stutzerimonas kirkiae]TBV08806.1 type II toxin-antitoxin system death-on-curing family toxin [Stutzerimonas kirkiae]TBV15641.1 type II toxin-antitoxin system death-on-curing family toxin [Stutzerimonas kirkiae]
MIVWIGKPLALAIHERQLAEHGGANGVRDEGLLDSALARQQQLHAYGEPPPDLGDLAANLAYGVARNHPFVDGNKRTAAVVCEVFIELNSGSLIADDLELYSQYIGLAEGSIDEAGFAQWLRSRIVIAPPASVQEPAGRYG